MRAPRCTGVRLAFVHCPSRASSEQGEEEGRAQEHSRNTPSPCPHGGSRSASPAPLYPQRTLPSVRAQPTCVKTAGTSLAPGRSIFPLQDTLPTPSRRYGLCESRKVGVNCLLRWP
eukprot:392370-Prymnesium_polylepis.1